MPRIIFTITDELNAEIERLCLSRTALVRRGLKLAMDEVRLGISDATILEEITKGRRVKLVDQPEDPPDDPPMQDAAPAAPTPEPPPAPAATSEPPPVRSQPNIKSQPKVVAPAGPNPFERIETLDVHGEAHVKAIDVCALLGISLDELSADLDSEDDAKVFQGSTYIASTGLRTAYAVAARSGKEGSLLNHFETWSDKLCV